MITVRDKIRSALGTSNLSVAEVSRATGLSPELVSTNLSAMKQRTKELVYTKLPGEYGKYQLKSPPDYHGTMKTLELKLAQLRDNRHKLRLNGITLIDEIIKDYEFFKSEFGLKSNRSK